MEPNGSPFAVDGISMAHIEDGTLAEMWLTSTASD